MRSVQTKAQTARQEGSGGGSKESASPDQEDT